MADRFDHGLDFEQFDLADLGVEARLDFPIGTKGARAAECIISSTAFITIVLSIPFSLETCSITRFRSTCISTPRGGPHESLPAMGAGARLWKSLLAPRHRELSFARAKVVFVVGTVYLIKSKRLAAALTSSSTSIPAVAHPDQFSDERLGPVARRMCSNPYALAPKGLEVLQLQKRPVDSRRSHLQQITTLYRVVHVEKIA